MNQIGRKRPKKATTIQDVAKAAGVSVSTVSRVLNDKDDVAPETYDRVKAIIEEMGYTSNLAAKSMRSRKTNVIGLIVPEVDDPFPIQVMRGVNQAISKLDHDLIVYTYGDTTKHSPAARERHYVALLNNSITDGVIVVTPAATTFPTAAPVVAVDPHYGSSDYPVVISTNREGALTAMAYLTELGHRRIGFIGGRPDLQSAIRRFEGYKDGLRQANIPLCPELVQAGDYSRAEGYRCAQRLLSLECPPTAIFAANDESALGVMKAANEMGLQIPRDLSLVGFDNIPEAAYANPGLTTVDQYIVQMGYIAVEMLVELIQGDALQDDVYKITTGFVIRDSCRAIAGDGASD
jgi:LacI family transcriptional regulator